MPWFEDHLAALGRSIDLRVETISSAFRYRSRRTGPGFGEKVRRASRRAAEAIDDKVVRPAKRVDPDLRHKVLLGALCIPILILAGVGIKALIGPPVVDRATDAEIARLQASLEQAGTAPSTGPADHFSQFVRPAGR
jgi:hypothetical protein